MWEYTTEAKATEPLNCVESLPVEVASPPPVTAASKLTVALASPPPCEGINYTSPKETIMASPEAAARQDGTDSVQDLPHHPALLLDL